MGIKTINGKKVNMNSNKNSGEIVQRPSNPMTQAELYRYKIRKIKEIEDMK